MCFLLSEFCLVQAGLHIPRNNPSLLSHQSIGPPSFRERAGIAGQFPGEGVQDFGNAPGVHGGMANVGAALGQIGLDEIEMAWGADLEFERGAVTPGGGPKNFPIDGHLAHQVAGLIEVAREPSGGRHNGKLEFCFVAIPPGFVESPIGVVQQQAREGE